MTSVTGKATPKQTIWQKIGGFFVKIEVAVVNIEKEVVNFVNAEVPKVEALIKAAEADYQLLLAAEQSPAVQAAIEAIEKFVMELAHFL